jgi:hypothetical protein
MHAPPLALLAALLAAAPARAQDASRLPELPSADQIAKSAEELAKSAADAAKSAAGTIGGLWNDAVGGLGPAGTPAQLSDEDKRFFAILETAGLRLTEFEIGKGVAPTSTYRFVAANDPTDAALAKAEALWRAYRDGADGMRARAKQKIARQALDTMATQGMALKSMDVTLTPWPDASYQVGVKAR